MNIQDFLTSNNKPETKDETNSHSDLLKLLEPLVKSPQPKKPFTETPESIISSLDQYFSNSPLKQPKSSSEDYFQELSSLIGDLSQKNKHIRFLAQKKRSPVKVDLPEKAPFMQKQLLEIQDSEAYLVVFSKNNKVKLEQNKPPEPKQKHPAKEVEEVVVELPEESYLETPEVSEEVSQDSSEEDEKTLVLDTDSDISSEEFEDFHSQTLQITQSSIEETQEELPPLKPFRFFKQKQQTKTGEREENCAKFGYLMKRRGTTNKFHERWVVLKGFQLIWYRSPESSVPKGAVSLPCSLVSVLEDQQCFALNLFERSFVFKSDNNGREWKFALDNNICYKIYLENTMNPSIEVVSFFKDLKKSSLVLKDLKHEHDILNIIAFSIPAHSNLKVVQLDRCCLNDQQLSLICESLLGNIQIETLSICENQITSEGIKSILELLKQTDPTWNTLVNLHLSGNLIEDEGLQLLCRGLHARFQQLYWPKGIKDGPFDILEISDNKIGDRGLMALNALLSKTRTLIGDESPQMRLVLSKNNFTSKSFMAFVDYISDFQGIYSLDLSYCEKLGPSDIQELAEGLKTNSSLMYLDLRGIPLEKTCIGSLTQALNTNYILVCVKISTNEGIAEELIVSEIGSQFSIEAY